MNDEKEKTSNNQMYDRMVGHLGDFMSKAISESDVEPPKSLYRELDKITDRYTTGKLIASGGMKEIYEVEDRKTGRQVAMAIVKQLKSKELIEQFIQEARITAKLEHPNIMPVYDIGIEKSCHAYFTMKFVTADNLGTIIKNLRKRNKEYQEKYPLPRLLEIFSDICDAVAFSNSKGILHLDLKPDNIQVGDFGEVLVCDWGLSRFKPELVNHEDTVEYINGQLTIHGQVFGSPGYMSPEQAYAGRETLDKYSDIYSLGCLLYTFLTLKPAYEGDSVEDILEKTAKGYFSKPSKATNSRIVPEALEAVCVKSMEYEKSDRYFSATELRDDVRSFLNGYATFAQQASFITRAVLFYKRQKALVLTLCVAFNLAVATAYIYFDAEKEKSEVVEALDEVVEALDKKEEEKEKAVKERDEQTAQHDQLFDVFSKFRKRLNIFGNLSIINGLNFMADRNFLAAAEALEDAEDESFNEHIALCKKIGDNYKEKALPRHLLYDLISLLNQDLFTAVIQRVLRSEAPYLDKLELIPLTEDLLKITNPDCKGVTLLVEEIFGQKYVSLTGIKDLYDISPLVLIPAQYVDLSHTQVSDLTPLLKMPLVSLNIRHTKVSDLSSLRKLPISSLDISYSRVKECEVLEDLPLTQVKVAGLKIDYVKYLAKHQKLKELYVSLTDTVPQNLPSGCIVTRETQEVD
ncbi:MAG: protein kinase [Lentisphaerales bacterium]|nr:protein kinase [Lentisphaerales bacterium]